jgi:PAS domain S-box-containing protein
MRNSIASKPPTDFFNALFDSLPGNSALLDSSGLILAVNESWRTFSANNGSVNNDGIGVNYLDVCADAAGAGDDYAQDVKTGLSELLNGRLQVFEFEYPCHSPTEPRWFRLIARPLKDAALGNFLVVHVDITERKLAEFALKKQAQVLNLVNDAVLVVDLNDRITYANKSACDLYGFTKSEMIGKLASDFQDDLPAYEFETKKQRVLSNRTWSGTFTELNRKNQKMTIGARWTLVREPRGSDVILKVHTDTTLQAQFLRSQRLQTIGNIAGGIAHDLNNILAPIVLLASAIQSDHTSPHAEVAGRISTFGQRASALVQQLVGFSRGFEGTRREESFHSILDEAVELLIPLTDVGRIRFNVESAAQHVKLNCNRMQIHQVMLNLILNARDSIKGDGTIAISAKPCEIGVGELAFVGDPRPGSYVELTVADTGTGISMPDLERLFEPFYSTKPLGHGTGLGLSTCLGIIRSHDGFVRVQSKPTKGSIFSVYLPIAAESAGQKRILVVDKNASTTSALREALQQSGFEVDIAENGDEAIVKFVNSTAPFDLVISDLDDTAGADLALHLNQIQESVQVIGMTESPLVSLRTAQEKVRLAGVIQKPVRNAEVLALVRRIC